MIVDLERNDLSRVAVTGSVEVEELYALQEWSGLWHAGSTVAAPAAAGRDACSTCCGPWCPAAR